MRRAKYRLPASQKGPGNFLYALLALGLLVLFIWFWWQSGQSARTQPKSKTSAATAPAVTPASRQTKSPPTVPAPTPAPATRSATPPPTTAAVPPATASGFPRPVQNTLEAQLALVQHGISPGSLDGSPGSQTRAAIAAFQLKEKIPATGELDVTTKTRLLLNDNPYTTYTITTADLARLQPIANTWVGKSQQTALDYETILELIAEKSFSSPTLIRRLNPSVDFATIAAGTSVQVPNATYPDLHTKAAFVKIHLSGKTLEAFDDATNLLVHFPCSIAQHVEKRPVGELHVAIVAPHPNYTFDPDIFPESAEAHTINHKLIIPPGPNNPVGVAWIGLDRPGYGIHGTPSPEQVGRTESHGCFRLANWNAEFLLRLITVGTPVYVVE